MNNLIVEAYSSGTTKIIDPDGSLQDASNLRYSTGYPGGLYLDASFYIPRDVAKYLALKGTKRIVFRNGTKIVYEGWIDSLDSYIDTSSQGIEIPVVGAWGRYAMRRYMRKRWSDRRLTEDIWQWVTAASGSEFVTVDRTSRIRFTPKAVDWLTDEGVAVQYTMPTGETIKRITYDYALTEGGLEWELYATRSTDGSSWTTMTDVSGETYATGTTTVISTTTTGSIDVTLATPSQYLRLVFRARANQTSTSDGASYGQFSNITVRSESGDINAYEITKDIRAAFTEINSDESYIDSNTLSLTPFIVDRWTSIADIFTQATEFGDSSFNRWASGFYNSEKAATPDGKPVLFLEQQPALTDYDYAIRLGEDNLVAPLILSRDYSPIYNYIIVEYIDENGNLQMITADDAGYTSLENSASQIAYGQREYPLNVGSSTATAAYNSGQRFLAAYKDPKYTLPRPITVVGHIRAKSGQLVPASEIIAGKRLKIENYLQDLSGTGLTFLISHTSYDDDSETCLISTGPPGDLIYPYFAFEPPMPIDEVITPSASGSSGGSDTERLNWKRKEGLIPGTPGWDEAVRLGKKKWYEKYR